MFCEGLVYFQVCHKPTRRPSRKKNLKMCLGHMLGLNDIHLPEQGKRGKCIYSLLLWHIQAVDKTPFSQCQHSILQKGFYRPVDSNAETIIASWWNYLSWSLHRLSLAIQFSPSGKKRSLKKQPHSRANDLTLNSKPTFQQDIATAYKSLRAQQLQHVDSSYT